MNQQTLPEQFVFLKEFDPSIQQAMKYACSDNFTGQVIPGYEQGSPDRCCIMTLDLAQKLKNIQAKLTEHWSPKDIAPQEIYRYGELSLLIWDAYRPQQAVDFLSQVWRFSPIDEALKQRFFPQYSKDDLFNYLFIAEQSGHSRGSTVDLTIAAKKNNQWQELDMGFLFDLFDPSSAPHFDSAVLNPSQRLLRKFFIELMRTENLTVLDNEIWHWFMPLNKEPYPTTYFDFPVRDPG